MRLPIVQFLDIIVNNMEHFASVVATEEQVKHFCEYVTGLIAGYKATIAAINALFLNTNDQSALSKFLTRAIWDERELNRRSGGCITKGPPRRRAPGTALVRSFHAEDHRQEQYFFSCWRIAKGFDGHASGITILINKPDRVLAVESISRSHREYAKQPPQAQWIGVVEHGATAHPFRGADAASAAM